MKIRSITAAANQAWTAVLVMMFAPPTAPDGGSAAPGHPERPGGDRGDVPGWVMITMMTAIVVIVLIGVFQDAVVTAVKNAFASITGNP